MNTTTTETTEAGTVHPFQAAGLGLAPFRYIGQVHQDIAYGQAVVAPEGTGPAVTTKPGGSCAYCGNYILHMFNVRSADGKTFHVGSDCIAKVGGPVLAAKVAKVVSANRKARTAASASEKIAAAVAALARPEVRSALEARPHPKAPQGSNGWSMFGYVDWLLARGGTAGKLRAAAIIAEVA